MGALLQDTHRSWADVEAVLQASCEMVLQLTISKDMAEMGMGGSCSQKDTHITYIPVTSPHHQLCDTINHSFIQSINQYIYIYK
jgi:hypothetical protein